MENNEYCQRCDYGMHICAGCGDYLNHEESVCQVCAEEIRKGKR